MSILLLNYDFTYGDVDTIATVAEYVNIPIDNLVLVVVQRYRRPVESRSPPDERFDTLVNELRGFLEIAYRESLASVDFAWRVPCHLASGNHDVSAVT